MSTKEFPPRSLPARQTITVGVYADELHWLIGEVERRAVCAAEAGEDGYADFLFQRVAALREAGR